MGILSIERYLRISYPFLYIRCMPRQRIFKILLCAWVAALVNTIIPVIFYRHEKYHTNCINTHPPLVYFSVNAAIVLVTIIIIVFCYSKIAYLAIKHNKSANARRLQARCENGDNINRKHWTTLLKSIKFCAIMCGIYFACAVPAVVTLSVGFSHVILEFLTRITVYIFSLHSLLNFFVSCRMNRDFFQALKKMFRDVTACCHCPKNNF